MSVWYWFLWFVITLFNVALFLGTCDNLKKTQRLLARIQGTLNDEDEVTADDSRRDDSRSD